MSEDVFKVDYFVLTN